MDSANVPEAVLEAEALRHLHGPLPTAQFFPTGGISLDTAHEWLRAGALAVGVGGDLVHYDPPQRDSKGAVQARFQKMVN